MRIHTTFSRFLTHYFSQSPNNCVIFNPYQLQEQFVTLSLHENYLYIYCFNDENKIYESKQGILQKILRSIIEISKKKGISLSREEC